MRTPTLIQMTRGFRIRPVSPERAEPKMATWSASQKVMAVTRQRSSPAGWDSTAVSQLPWAALENAVVMPQVMQGLSNQTTHEQSGSPRRVCVPWPAAFGVSEAAMPSTPRHAVAVAAAVARSVPVARRALAVAMEADSDWRGGLGMR